MRTEEPDAEQLEQLPYAYWLNNIEGLGNRTKKELVNYAGSPKEVYGMPLSDIQKLVQERKWKNLERAKTEKAVIADYKSFMENKSGMRFIPMLHPEYPAKLLQTDDAPFALYVQGKLPHGQIPAVAVIGARQCSEYGRHMAERCGMELAEAGIQVISGMARGIDGIAQGAALRAGGEVYAVLGCGVDICYPEQNRNIYEQLKTRGGICSEYLPQTAPRPQLFPPRNRIISGLSDIVLIIEAREKSGTLITADMALEQGREVYALPGRVTDSLSEGCNRLLRQGAGVFVSVKEMLEENGWQKKNRHTFEKSQQTEKNYASQEEQEKERVLSSLDFYPLSISELLLRTNMEYRRLIYLLFQLGMEGRVRQISADSYILTT